MTDFSPEASLLWSKLIEAKQRNGGSLSKAEGVAILALGLAAVAEPKRPPRKPAFSMGAGLSDDAWLTELSLHAALIGLNVRQEVESCRLWSASRGVQPSRKRIVNWLIRAAHDKPFKAAATGQFAGVSRPLPALLTPDEPLGWSIAVKGHESLDWAHGRSWAGIDPYYQKQIIRLVGATTA